MKNESKPDISGALALQYDPNSDMGMVERFETLSAALYANTVNMIERHRTTGVKRNDEEKLFQEESMQQLKYLDKIITILKKHGRIDIKPVTKDKENVLAKVIEMKNSIGDIITKIPVNKTKEA